MIIRNRSRVLCLILLISVILSLIFVMEKPSYSVSLSDIDNHWAKSYIQSSIDFKAINGYPDGTFKPNDNIKRIEFISLIVNSQGISVRNQKDGEFWGNPYVEAALENNLVRLYEYGSMSEPTLNRYISREEMASIVVNAYTNSGGTQDPSRELLSGSKLTDLHLVTPSYLNNAVTSVELGFILGYPDGTFAPKKNALRAEAAVISYRLLSKQGIIPEDYLPINVIFSKNKLQQGDMLNITVHHANSSSDVTVVQDLYPGFKWYASNDVLQGYIPTNYHTKPGIYILKFINSKTGHTTTKVIDITTRDFKVQYLTVNPTIEANTRTAEANAEYRKYFNPSREVSSPVKYYTGPFILPTKGRLTTEFGETRTVNGAPTTYRHAGLDIAAPLNSSVLATNTGRVTLSMPLILTGNSIVIDHGQGLFSVYFHLEKLLVSHGDIVERGQLIGTVGSTGFSTGPHLHFTMSHYGVNIEPGYIIYGESITKNNYLELMK